MPCQLSDSSFNADVARPPLLRKFASLVFYRQLAFVVRPTARAAMRGFPCSDDRVSDHAEQKDAKSKKMNC